MRFFHLSSSLLCVDWKLWSGKGEMFPIHLRFVPKGSLEDTPRVPTLAALDPTFKSGFAILGCCCTLDCPSPPILAQDMKDLPCWLRRSSPHPTHPLLPRNTGGPSGLCAHLGDVVLRVNCGNHVLRQRLCLSNARTRALGAAQAFAFITAGLPSRRLLGRRLDVGPTRNPETFFANTQGNKNREFSEASYSNRAGWVTEKHCGHLKTIYSH